MARILLGLVFLLGCNNSRYEFDCYLDCNIPVKQSDGSSVRVCGFTDDRCKFDPNVLFTEALKSEQ